MAHVSGNFGTDAQLTNKSSKSSRISSDLDLFFTRKANKDVKGIDIITAAIKVDFFAISETTTTTKAVVINLIK